MHTFKKEDWRIHYNSDFSGYVTITNDRTGARIRMPAYILLSFAAEYVRDKKISKIHEATDLDILLGN